MARTPRALALLALDWPNGALGSAQAQEFMNEPAARNPRSTLQIILGFLLGVIACLLFLFLAMFLASTLGPRRNWTEFLFVAIALVLAGSLSLKNFRRSSYSAGLTIAFSLGLLVDAVCAAILK